MFGVLPFRIALQILIPYQLISIDFFSYKIQIASNRLSSGRRLSRICV